MEPHLDFKAGNPGAVQYGNFINYYEFHPPENRLHLLPSEIFKDLQIFHGLDLGCNSGDLTISLYNSLKATLPKCSFLALDIDPTLIQRAKEKTETIEFVCLDFMKTPERKVIADYLNRNEIEKFKCVFCFSITMWIHLNFGDEGLKSFLEEASKLGEFLVVEPQPWKCYRSAVKRMKMGGSDFPLYKDLQIRGKVEEDIENYIVGHCGMSKIFESERTKWGRKLLVFKRNAAT